jgi:hypothetical protein
MSKRQLVNLIIDFINPNRITKQYLNKITQQMFKVSSTCFKPIEERSPNALSCSDFYLPTYTYSYLNFFVNVRCDKQNYWKQSHFENVS